MPIEDGRHGLHGRQLVFDLVEERRLENTGGFRRLVAVVLEDVPPAKHEVVEVGERDELADGWRASLGPLAKPNGTHLRERADWRRELLANRHHTRNRCRADRAEPYEEDA